MAGVNLGSPFGVGGWGIPVQAPPSQPKNPTAAPGTPGAPTAPAAPPPAPENPYFGTGQTFLNFNNVPAYPRYRSSVNPDNGQVLDQYSLKSQWLPMAQAKLQTDTTANVNTAQGLGDRNAAGAWSRLAQSGGLSSGAKERMAYSSGRDTTNQIQETLGKSQSTGQGMIADAAKGDLETALGDLGSSNSHNMGLYQTAMQGWAAKQSADAARRAANSQGTGLLGGSIIPGIL